MEMLIVVAIIAVLIAIAIPVFSNQLEKARDAVSIANLRSAYAEAQVAYLLGDGDNALVKTYHTTGEIETIEVANVVFKGTNDNGFSRLGADLPFDPPTEEPSPAGPYTVVFTYDVDGKVTGTSTK